METQLWKQGFKQPVDQDHPLICRWDFSGIVVDVMPSDCKVLGFSNRWYPQGIANRKEIVLPDQTAINILSLPYFVATKLEAFHGRGGNDPRLSHDLDDIILVLTGNTTAQEQLAQSSKEVRIFLSDEFKTLQKHVLFKEAVEGFLAGRGETSGQVRKVLDTIRAVADLD